MGVIDNGICVKYVYLPPFNARAISIIDVRNPYFSSENDGFLSDFREVPQTSKTSCKGFFAPMSDVCACVAPSSN